MTQDQQGRAGDLVGLTPEALADRVEALGHLPGQARVLFTALHKKLATDLENVSGLSRRLVDRLQRELPLTTPRIVTHQIGQDETQKWLLELTDGSRVETVYIPERNRGTLCLSCQVGCSLDCHLCSTGTQGLTRNLTAAELVAQSLVVRHALRDVGQDLTNVVLMGMGEPLYNWDAVAQAVKVIAAGLGIGANSRRFSISTVGVSPRLHWVARDLGCNLIVSLHASSDAVRDRIIPLNRRYPLATIRQALLDHPQRDRDVSFAYTLLDGVNDTEQDAERLIVFLEDIPSRVNLLPLNRWPSCPFDPSSEKKTQRFSAILSQAGITTTVRRRRGEDIAAACGQLRSQ
jgi:23S rRNA (adenine2503-C2)-methyltransferase